jgi:integrase
MYAWRDWLSTRLADEAALAASPCFPPLTRGGQVLDKPVSTAAVTSVIRKRAREAGLSGRWGGRSLRAGFVTTAVELEIPLEEIARQTGHASIDTMVRYIRTQDPFHRNAASRVGL